MASLKRYASFLCSIELVVAGIAVLIGIVKSQALPFVLAVMLVFWLLRWLAHGRLTVRTPADLPVAGLVAMASLSLVITTFPERTFLHVLNLVLGIAFFYAVVNWTSTRGRINFLYISLVIFPLLLCLIGVAGAAVTLENMKKLPFISNSIYSYVPRFFVDSVNPNILAGNLVYVLPFALCALLFRYTLRSNWIRLLAIAVVVITVSVSVLTQSRNAIMGLAVVFVMAFLLRWPKRWYLLLVPAFFIGAVTWYFRESDQLRFYGQIIQGGVISTLDQRVSIWMRALYMMQDYPLTGIGMGLFPVVSDALYPFSVEPIGMPHAHNLFLQIAVDLGTPGLISWLAIWLTMVYLSFDMFRQRSDFKGIGASLLISQAALASVGLFDCVVWGEEKTAILPWGVWGLGMAAWILSKSLRLPDPFRASGMSNEHLAESSLVQKPVDV